MGNTFFSDDLADLKRQFEAAPRKAVVFYHIHKTGGRTLKGVLRQSYPETSFHVSSPADVDAFLALMNRGELDVDRTIVVEGHRAHLVADQLTQRMPVFGITVLRRPVEMFQSRYSYQHTRHSRDDLTLELFAATQGRNPVLRHFGFRDYEQAASAFSNKLSFVGLREELEESIRMLVWVLSLPPGPYRNKNIARADDYWAIDQNLVPQVLEQHRDDVMFYQHMAFRHSTMRRQFSLLNVERLPLLFSDEKSAPPRSMATFDLGPDAGKLPLFLSGCALFPDDRDQAMVFFNRSFERDWGMFRRIFVYLRDADPEFAESWRLERLAFLKTLEGVEATRVTMAIERWGPKEETGA